MTIVEHIEYRVPDHDAFVAAFARVRGALLAARGCRSVDVTRSGDVYRVRIEWRSSADRDALERDTLDGVLAAFERRGHSIDTPLDFGHGDAEHDAAALRRAFGQFPSGVAVVTAMAPSGPVAVVVSSFTSVSLKPTLVSFCVAHTSTTWPIIVDTKGCCINVLAAAQSPLVKQLTAKREDRFDGVEWRPAPSGAPILVGAVGWLDCTIHDTRRAGDHDVVILSVRAYDVDASIEPLLFHRSGYRTMAP